MTNKNIIVEGVIKHTGKNPQNNGDFYGSTGHNGMRNYHRWAAEADAKTFPSKEKAQQYKNKWKADISPMYGRVILKPTIKRGQNDNQKSI